MISVEQVMPLAEYLINHRHVIHQYPEAGFNTFRTHDYILHELESLNIKVIPHIGKNSLVGVIANQKGPVIGLRADIDALPLEEQNTSLPYVSQNHGFMHACGHDAHTSMLLGTAKYLSENRDLWKGTVKLIFQEAEEGPNPGGAKAIVDSGKLDDVSAFFALHVSPDYPSKQFAMKKGDAFAAVVTFKIMLKGKGCHAAYPHLGIDPIIMQAEVIQAFQTIISRKLAPLEKAVLSVTQSHSGTTHNIIPDKAYLEGTIRYYTPETKLLIKSEMTRILDSITQRHQGGYDFDFIEEYDAVFNSPSAFEYFKNVAIATFGENSFQELFKPSMGGEDFYRYVNLKQGCIAWLGTRTDETTGFGLHHPKFNIDEDALIYGTTQLINLVIDYKRSESSVSD